MYVYLEWEVSQAPDVDGHCSPTCKSILIDDISATSKSGPGGSAVTL